MARIKVHIFFNRVKKICKRICNIIQDLQLSNGKRKRRLDVVTMASLQVELAPLGWKKSRGREGEESNSPFP